MCSMAYLTFEAMGFWISYIYDQEHASDRPAITPKPIRYFGASSEGNKYAPYIPDKLSSVLTKAKLSLLFRIALEQRLTKGRPGTIRSH